MIRFLVIFKANWCDEFDCEQFTITDVETTLKDINAEIDEVINEYNGFGGNQGFEMGSLSRANFRIYELSEHEIAIFNKFFPGRRFGTGIL